MCQENTITIKVSLLRVWAFCTHCEWQWEDYGNAVKEAEERSTQHACENGHTVRIAVKFCKEIIPKGVKDNEE